MIYKKLFDSLKRPMLYERTVEKFWTDPHIATQMMRRIWTRIPTPLVEILILYAAVLRGFHRCCR